MLSDTYQGGTVAVSTLRRYVFSAKGAAFRSSLGQRPRKRGIPKASALKARFIFDQGFKASYAPRRAESRFQRLVDRRNQVPGAMPQATNECAPLALNRYLQRVAEVEVALSPVILAFGESFAHRSEPDWHFWRSRSTDDSQKNEIKYQSHEK